MVGPANFGAKTCGSIFDSDPNRAFIAHGDSTVPASSVAEIRTRAIAAGWQPQKNGRYALALLGPDHYQIGIKVEGDSAVVRAELDRCSVRTRSSMLGNSSLPIPEPAQQRSLADTFALATPVVRRLLETAGATWHDEVFPESARLADADAVLPENCLRPDDKRLGVQWRAQVEADLPGSTDLGGFFGSLRAIPGHEWIVDRDPTKDQLRLDIATRDGTRIWAHTVGQASQEGGNTFEFRLFVESPCVPVTPSAAS
ncbi:hypothetical protein [Embleya sp. NPDC001921]